MHGPKANDLIYVTDGSVNIAVANQAVIYTASFKLELGVYFGLAYRAVVFGGGTPDIKIQLEESWTLPATEGSADLNYVVPVNMADIETNLISELWRIKNLSPVPMQYGRLRITGNSGNPSGTIVNAKLSVQSSYY